MHYASRTTDTVQQRKQAVWSVVHRYEAEPRKDRIRVARTEAPGEGAAQLHLVHRQRVLQGLRVRVDRPELDALRSGDQRSYELTHLTWASMRRCWAFQEKHCPGVGRTTGEGGRDNTIGTSASCDGQKGVRS